MTNEEIQRTLEFLIKQQATFADNMEKAEARMSRLETAFIGLFNVVNDTAKSQQGLVENQRKLAESQEKLAESQKELWEAQKRTDERLNVLINTVERFISEGRNGRQSG